MLLLLIEIVLSPTFFAADSTDSLELETVSALFFLLWRSDFTLSSLRDLLEEPDEDDTLSIFFLEAGLSPMSATELDDLLPLLADRRLSFLIGLLDRRDDPELRLSEPLLEPLDEPDYELASLSASESLPISSL